MLRFVPDGLNHCLVNRYKESEMPIYIPNKLGWVTDITFNMNPDQLLTFDISGAVLETKGVATLFQDWMYNGIRNPTFQEEWKCLYCTSPNTIDKTHCTQCGAPRNFILG